MKKLTVRLGAILLLLALLCVPVSAAAELIPGGQVIGLCLSEGSLTVVEIHKELGKSAQEAGLKAGDKLTAINGQTVTNLAEVRSLLKDSPQTVELSILRSGKEKCLHLTPVATSEGPRLGIYLKEGVTGIGTVTYYDPATGTYGALGHGVNDPSGAPVVMKSGKAYEAAILSVQKGECGKPGQLMGALTGEDPIGTVEKNTCQGIFGTLPCPRLTALPIAKAKIGPAVIRSTVDQNGIREYSVEILKIYPHSAENGRNMLIKITDDALLTATGGIVQGMSGSPIIQDGKLVGAVTHVLVNDPTTGYGIFIENMLDAAA